MRVEQELGTTYHSLCSYFPAERISNSEASRHFEHSFQGALRGKKIIIILRYIDCKGSSNVATLFCNIHYCLPLSPSSTTFLPPFLISRKKVVCTPSQRICCKALQATVQKFQESAGGKEPPYSIHLSPIERAHCESSKARPMRWSFLSSCAPCSSCSTMYFSSTGGTASSVARIVRRNIY